MNCKDNGTTADKWTESKIFFTKPTQKGDEKHNNVHKLHILIKKLNYNDNMNS